MLSYEEIVNKIVAERGLSKEDVEEKIKQKREELENLVTLDGAAYIVAHELGIKLFKVSSSRLKIGNILPGLRRVDFVGRVLKIYDPIEYERDGKKNLVQSILVGDETGRVRVVIWSRKLIENLKNLEVGDAVRISGAYSKENKYGKAEVHLRESSKFEINPNIELPPLEEIWQTSERSEIATLEEGRFEIKGTLVYVFEPSEYNACPKCGKKLVGDICEEHGKVEPVKVKIQSFVVDDGTGNIRVTVFRNLAENFKYELGDELTIVGDVSFNEVSGSYEMLARNLSKTNARTEVKKLTKELTQ